MKRIMFIADKFVYLETRKSGSSHIGKLLAEVCDGRQVGKHNVPKARLLASGRHFIASIRDPWSWYLSLWRFGCWRGVGLARRLSHPAIPTDISKPLLYPRRFSRFLRARRMAAEWRTLYDDGDDVSAFQEWLRRIHDPRYIDSLDHYCAESPYNEVAGLYSLHFLDLCCRRPGKGIAGEAGIDSLRRHVAENCYVDYFIHNENLEQDLLGALAHCGVTVTEQQRQRICSAPRTNAAPANRPLAEHYTDELVELIATRDRIITEKFSYSPPALDGGGTSQGNGGVLRATA